MKSRLDMNKITTGLRAQPRGELTAGGGYFGAMQLAADLQARLRVPSRGGRPTDPAWTERRLVPLTPRTLKRLEEIAAKVCKHGTASLEPMQLAALLLEEATEGITGTTRSYRRRSVHRNHKSLEIQTILGAIATSETLRGRRR